MVVTAWVLALTVLWGLLAAGTGVGRADDKATVEFSHTTNTLEVPYGQTASLPLTVTLSISQATPVNVTYEVTSNDLTADDVEPFGEQTLAIPPAAMSETITFSIQPNAAWITGTRTLTVTLQGVNPDEAVELGSVLTATVALRRTHRAFVSLASRDEVWQQVDAASRQTGVRSLAVCPSDSTIRYLGSDSGLFRWQTDKWMAVKDQGGVNVPGSAREITFGKDCNEVYAAVLGSGVWREKNRNNNTWEKLDPGAVGDDLLTSRTVVVRDDVLYVGSDTGVYYIDLGPDGEWVPALPDKVIARLTLAGSRIYAAVWMEGVAYDDNCPDDCDWKEIAGPESDHFVREVVGPPPDDQNRPAWLIFATASTVYYLNGWDGEHPIWLTPDDDDRPQPIGNIFSLAQDRGRHYAGVENGGVWLSIDKGHTWNKVGNLSATVRDMAVTATGKLFAATFDDGVWH